MPTYEYRCSDCGHQFETHRRIDDEPLTVCERCGGRLRKVFHAAGIVFKGSGFYATDSRAAAKKAGSKEGSDAKSDSRAGAKPEPKSDSKSSDAKESTSSSKDATKKAESS
jgi:putative FmdB family regulatory protein